MKIAELLTKLDLSKKEKYHVTGDFLSEFDYQEFDVDIDKVELFCIRLVTWYCTDTFVGTLLVLLNNEPICFSNQVGRKYDEEFHWVSKEAWLKAKEVVEKAKVEKEYRLIVIDPSQEFGEYYRLNFANDLISGFHDVAFYNEKKVFVKKIESKDYIERRVQITFEDGTSEVVEINNLKFPITGIK